MRSYNWRLRLASRRASTGLRLVPGGRHARDRVRGAGPDDDPSRGCLGGAGRLRPPMPRATHRLPSPAAAGGARRRICCASRTSGFGEALLHAVPAARESGDRRARHGDPEQRAAGLSRRAGDQYDLADRARARAHRGLSRRRRRQRPRRPGLRAATVATASSPSTSAPEIRRLPPRRWPGCAGPARRCTCATASCSCPTLGKVPSLSAREAEVLTLGGARQEQRRDRRDPRHLGAYRRRASPPGLLKLGVFDRMSAALRGLGFGLISLDEPDVP